MKFKAVLPQDCKMYFNVWNRKSLLLLFSVIIEVKDWVLGDEGGRAQNFSYGILYVLF